MAHWLTKRWPPEHFAEVARCAAEFGAGLIAVGSADDRPCAMALRRMLKAAGVLDLTGATSLIQLAALAQEADLFLSNDTGPLHLAAAAGSAVIGIYTCTDPDLTGPYGPAADDSAKLCLVCAKLPQDMQPPGMPCRALARSSLAGRAWRLKLAVESSRPPLSPAIALQETQSRPA